MKENMFAQISGCVSDFLYYDRKEDEDLPVGAIEKMIEEGLITVEEIANEFKKELESSLC